MHPRSFDAEIHLLRQRVGAFRERAADGDGRVRAEEMLVELSNALEELRVASEELDSQHEELRRRDRERELERRKYQELFQAAPNGYIVTDEAGVVREVNSAAQRMLGVRASTLVGTPLAARVVPADIPKFRRMLSLDPPDELATELRLRRRGGQNFIAAAVRTVIRHPEDAVTGHRWSIHDLTSVKVQEEDLRRSEALLRSLVDGAKDFAIFRIDEAFRICSWNAGAERIFGYDAVETLGRSFEILHAPDDRSGSEQQLLRLAERYGRAEVEGWRLHKDGRRLWMNSVFTPLRDRHGRLTGFVCVLRDVTDRRRTEEALAERSRLSLLQADVGTALTEGGHLEDLLQRCAYATLVNLGAALVRIWTVDEDGAALRLRACSGDHRPLDRLPSRVSLVSPVEVARVARGKQPYTTNDLLSEPDLSCSAWAKRKGVSWYSGRPLVLDGRLAGVFEVFSVAALDDLSEQALETVCRSVALGLDRKRAEEGLSHTLQQLEHIMETMPEAVFTLDPDGRLLQWNRKLERETGFARERLEERSIVDLVPREDSARVLEMMAAALTSGQAEWEGHILRADGSTAPISWALAARKDAESRIVGLTGSGRNITERRESEMRLAQLSRRLLHLREEEERKIARELHDSTAQNLAALCMNVSSLDRATTQLDGPSRRLVREAGELAERCLREVRTISYLLHPPLLDEVGLSAALRWYTKGFAKRSGVKVRVLARDLGRLDPDLERTIFRIVQESLTNVHRHAQAGTVSVDLRRQKTSLLLKVTDDGRGIAAFSGGDAGPKNAKRDSRRRPPGKRLRLSARREMDWMGLGLMGIRERVHEWKGRFEIESNTKGTTVRVEVPLPERAVS